MLNHIHTYIHVLSPFFLKVTSFSRGWPCGILASAHLLFISRSFNVIIRTYPQFYHDLITMRGAMPTHLGANPRNHVNHDSCSSLENFYYYLITYYLHSFEGTCVIVCNCKSICNNCKSFENLLYILWALLMITYMMMI